MGSGGVETASARKGISCVWCTIDFVYPYYTLPSDPKQIIQTRRVQSVAFKTPLMWKKHICVKKRMGNCPLILASSLR